MERRQTHHAHRKRLRWQGQVKVLDGNRAFRSLAQQMKISIPNLSLVVLIGSSGSGKSTFARKHFLPTEVLSSDACRGMVSDEENNQAVTNEAFALLHFIAAQRLAL